MPIRTLLARFDAFAEDFLADDFLAEDFLLFAVVSIFFFMVSKNTPQALINQLGKSLHLDLRLCDTLLRDSALSDVCLCQCF